MRGARAVRTTQPALKGVRNVTPCPTEYLHLDFRFEDLLDNLPTSPVAFIHAGFNAMKTLRRATPNG